MKTRVQSLLLAGACILAASILSTSLVQAAIEPVQNSSSISQAADTTAIDKAPQPQEPRNVDTFWALARLGGFIAYIILAVLVLGIFIVISKAVSLGFEWWNFRDIRSRSFQGYEMDAIKSTLAGSQGSMLRNILQHLFDFYEAGGNANVIRDELNALIYRELQHFETFQGRLSFLADAAGALGLLGTVWGIFQTFFGGNLEPEKILNGMGIALITTLFGLVVSLLINLAGTRLETTFSKRIDQYEKSGDALRLQFMNFDIQKQLLAKTVEDGNPIAETAKESSASNGNP